MLDGFLEGGKCSERGALGNGSMVYLHDWKLPCSDHALKLVV
jgi:hypothetical protein